MFLLLFFWIFWIVVTFWMDKNSEYRYNFAVLSLSIIILFPVTVKLGVLQFSGPSLLLLLISYLVASKLSFKKQLYVLFSIISLMTGYAGFLLLELYDPVLIIIDRRIILSIVAFIIAFIIYPSSIQLRLIFLILGTILGDLIFAIILTKWNIPYTIGAVDSLDFLTVTTALIFINHFITRIHSYTKLHKNKKALS